MKEPSEKKGRGVEEAAGGESGRSPREESAESGMSEEGEK